MTKFADLPSSILSSGNSFSGYCKNSNGIVPNMIKDKEDLRADRHRHSWLCCFLSGTRVVPCLVLRYWILRAAYTHCYCLLTRYALPGTGHTVWLYARATRYPV
eukprot:2523300-Rhodomonas_salina.1